MTKFENSIDHELDCMCSYCSDVDPSKSVSRELERYIEELMIYAVNNLTEEQQISIHKIAIKISLLRRYFPTMELPSKHARILSSEE